MKKILMLLMAITVLLTFAACGEDNESKTEPTEHKHSYRSEVTTPATCEKEGVVTLTCDCGDSYTEKIYACPISFILGRWQTILPLGLSCFSPLTPPSAL